MSARAYTIRNDRGNGALPRLERCERRDNTALAVTNCPIVHSVSLA